MLVGYALLCVQRQGETLAMMSGVVERCAVLGGASDKLSHATIKNDNGAYLIAKLQACKPDTEVVILVQRGALYFNTVYAAQAR